MPVSYSPNMYLPIPGVGSTSGPDYAFDVNSALTLLDSHDHTPGKGVLITPSALNINATLPFNNNFLNSVAGVVFTAQGSVPSSNGVVYESGVDLYYKDGNGNAIRITQSGGVAGTPGSISGLASPASASYIPLSKTFVFQSNTNAAANLDGASVNLRNITPNSTYALTLSPPTSLASSYTLTFPTLPASQSFITVDNTGQMATPVVYPLVNAGIATRTITADRIVSGTLTNNEIAASTILKGNVNLTSLFPSMAVATFTSNGTFVVPTGINQLFTFLCGGGGGGGGGARNTGGVSFSSGGAGGGGSTPQIQCLVVSPGDILTITVGAGGTHGSAASGTAAGGNGGDGGATYITNGSGQIIAYVEGGTGGGGGVLSSGTAIGGAGPDLSNGIFNLVRVAGGSNGSVTGAQQGSISIYNSIRSAVGSGNSSGYTGGSCGGNGLGVGGGGGNAAPFVVNTPASAGGNGGYGAGGGGGGPGTNTNGAGAANGGDGGSGIVYLFYPAWG